MIIMKFGGSSIADAPAIARTIQHVHRRLREEPVVVVSALAEVTNQLTELARSSAAGNLTENGQQLDLLIARHQRIAQELLSDPTNLTPALAALDGYFQGLQSLCQQIASQHQLTPGDLAAILAYGELLSSTLVHYAMSERGIKNVWLDARELILTQGVYPNQELLLTEMAKLVPPLIGHYQARGYTVLTQGFIAGTVDRRTTILGREGSDYSATILGMLLDAKEVQIWTDVDGIMTADPRLVRHTQVLAQLSFREAAKLAYFGAKVIHPLTTWPAEQKDIPIRILNSRNLDSLQIGTTICAQPQTTGPNISSITHQLDLQMVELPLAGVENVADLLNRIGAAVNTPATTLSTVAMSNTHLTLLLNREPKAELATDWRAIHPQAQLNEQAALICLVGDLRSQYLTLTLATIARALADKEYRILPFTPNNSSLLLMVQREILAACLQALHDAFFGTGEQCLQQSRIAGTSSESAEGIPGEAGSSKPVDDHPDSLRGSGIVPAEGALPTDQQKPSKPTSFSDSSTASSTEA